MSEADLYSNPLDAARWRQNKKLELAESVKNLTPPDRLGSLLASGWTETSLLSFVLHV